MNAVGQIGSDIQTKNYIPIPLVTHNIDSSCSRTNTQMKHDGSEGRSPGITIKFSVKYYYSHLERGYVPMYV